eukprot:jgi/Hompol1/5031/HPOL_000566-RA
MRQLLVALLAAAGSAQPPPPTGLPHIPTSLPPIPTSLPPLSSSNQWLGGIATHYGPCPSDPSENEIGFQPNEVGVGCSNGDPGGDPHWNAILRQGTRRNPLDNSTVWPLIPVVAVSESAWVKSEVCWQSILIRNAANHSMQVTAVIVDFCPTQGCLWAKQNLSRNVDIYGDVTFFQLGGVLVDGIIDIEVQWPSSISPRNSASTFWTAYTLYTLVAVMFIVSAYLAN